jgi:hypothetical protein
MDQHNKPHTIRIIIKPGITEEDVAELAVSVGWIPLGSRPASPRNPYAFVWEDENHDVEIHYVYDNLLDMAYLYLQGRNTHEVELLARAGLASWTYVELLDQLKTATRAEDVIDAICRIALSREAETHEAVNLLVSATSGDAGIRRAVITAAGYLEWPPLIELAQRLRACDPDVEVREEAALVLDAIAEHERPL